MSSAEAFGQLVGLGICILLPLVVIIANGVSMRRHRTNALCALAIIGTLLAVILGSLAGLGSQATHVPLTLLQTLSFSAAGIMLLSTVLAIIGLIQFSIKRRRYVRGRWRAVTALLLNALFLTFFFINVAKGVNQGLAWRKLLQPKSKGAPVTNATWNFRIQPPFEWGEINPTAFGPEVRAAIARNHPEMFAMVFAEHLPDDSETTLAGAMDLLKHSLRADREVEFLQEEEKTERDFVVRTLEMRSHDLATSHFHVFWIMRDGNTLYRISTWGADSDAGLIREESRKIANGFELVEPQRTRPKSTPKPTVAMLAFPSAR